MRPRKREKEKQGEKSNLQPQVGGTHHHSHGSSTHNSSAQNIAHQNALDIQFETVKADHELFLQAFESKFFFFFFKFLLICFII